MKAGWWDAALALRDLAKAIPIIIGNGLPLLTEKDLFFSDLFFEIRALISIWVSIKIETKFEFMEFDCDVKEILSDW